MHSENECASGDNDDEDAYCLADNMSSDRMSALTVCAVVLLLAVGNACLVSVAANMLEQQKTHRAVDNARLNVRKRYELIKKHAGTCHFISIITLIAMSILVLLIQALYIHYQQEGGNILFTLANQLGSVGFSTVCIGLGVFILVSLWNTTINIIDTNDTVLVIEYPMEK